jgi:hypothetical protein
MNLVGPHGEGLVIPVTRTPAGGGWSEAAAGLPGADLFITAEVKPQTRLPATLRRGKHRMAGVLRPMHAFRHMAHSLRRADAEVDDGLGESARIALRRVFEDLTLVGHLFR